MTGPIAGYTTAIIALLFAASVALTIIRTARRVEADEQAFRTETPEKLAA